MASSCVRSCLELLCWCLLLYCLFIWDFIQVSKQRWGSASESVPSAWDFLECQLAECWVPTVPILLVNCAVLGAKNQFLNLGYWRKWYLLFSGETDYLLPPTPWVVTNQRCMLLKQQRVCFPYSSKTCPLITYHSARALVNISLLILGILMLDWREDLQLKKGLE